MKATFDTLSPCFYTLHSRTCLCMVQRGGRGSPSTPCQELGILCWGSSTGDHLLGILCWGSSAQSLPCSIQREGSISQPGCERRECSRNGRCLNRTLTLQPREHHCHCMTLGGFYGLNPLLQTSACLRFYKHMGYV